MSVQDTYAVAKAVILSIGSASVLVLGLSAFLGKVFAGRILASERASFELELQRLRTDLEILRESYLKAHHQKVDAYRGVADMVAKLIASLNIFYAGKLPPESQLSVIEKFTLRRCRIYGQLGMFAPQTVMDKYDALMDLLVEVVGGTKPYEWTEIRKRSLAFINEVRVDVGFDKSPIEYRGVL